MLELKRQLASSSEALERDLPRLGRPDGPALQLRVEGPAILRSAFSSLLSSFPQLALGDTFHGALLLMGDDWEGRAAALEEQGAIAAAMVLMTNRLTDLNIAQQRGIQVFVHEGEPVSELLSGIVAASRRKPFQSPMLLQSLMQSIQRAPSNHPTIEVLDGVGNLSAREREVAVQAAAGLSNHQIAQRLQISHATVRFHLHSVFQKLGISRRGELVRFITPIGTIL